MPEEARRENLEPVKDERGRLLGRLDRATERLEVKPYRGSPSWIDLRKLLDKKQPG